MNEGIRDRLLRDLGGGCNILSVTNCMTRVRVTMADESMVDENGVRKTETVLGLVHDRENNYEIVVGPGRCREYAQELGRSCVSKSPVTEKR